MGTAASAVLPQSGDSRRDLRGDVGSSSGFDSCTRMGGNRRQHLMSVNHANIRRAACSDPATDTLSTANSLTRIRNFMLVLGSAFAAMLPRWKFGCPPGSRVPARIRHRLPQLPLAQKRVSRAGRPRHEYAANHSPARGSSPGSCSDTCCWRVAAYAILTSFPASLRGLFAGLFLPVAAIACEAAYELYVAIAVES